MKDNRFFLMITLIVISGGIFTGCGGPPKAPTKIEFQTDLEAAGRIAEDKNQPLVVEFYTSDCPWCKMLDDSTFSNKIVIGMAEKMVFVKIDGEKDTALVKSFGVAYYPTIVVARSDGSEIDRLVGYFPPTDFYNEIQLFLLGKETLEDYLTRLQDEPEKIEYHLIVAEKYRNRSDWDKALEYYGNVIRLSSDNRQSEVEEAMFETAGIYAERGDYKKSIIGYQSFLRRFPKSEKSENARRRIPYYMVQTGELKKAMELFKGYLDDYPQGEYVDWVNQRIDELNKALGKRK